MHGSSQRGTVLSGGVELYVSVFINVKQREEEC
jgi:hypothetical protein